MSYECANDYAAIMEYDPDEITSEEDARVTYESILCEVVEAHPEDMGADIVADDGHGNWAYVFTAEQAERYDAVMARIQGHIGLDEMFAFLMSDKDEE